MFGQGDETYGDNVSNQLRDDIVKNTLEINKVFDNGLDDFDDLINDLPGTAKVLAGI